MPVRPRIAAAHLELTRSARPVPGGVRGRNQETSKRARSEVSRRRPGAWLANSVRGPVRALPALRLSETARRRGAPFRGEDGGDRARPAPRAHVRLRVSLRLPSAACLTDLRSRARLRRHRGPPPRRLAKGGPSGPLPSSTHGTGHRSVPPEACSREGTVGTPPVQGPLRDPRRPAAAPGAPPPSATTLNTTEGLPTLPDQSKKPSTSGPFWNVLYI